MHTLETILAILAVPLFGLELVGLFAGSLDGAVRIALGGRR